MTISDLRQEANKYILEKLVKLSTRSSNVDLSSGVPLHELLLLKEGTADPSPALIASIRELLRGIATEAEIKAHFVEPFK